MEFLFTLIVGSAGANKSEKSEFGVKNPFNIFRQAASPAVSVQQRGGIRSRSPLSPLRARVTRLRDPPPTPFLRFVLRDLRSKQVALKSDFAAEDHFSAAIRYTTRTLMLTAAGSRPRRRA